MAAGEPGFCTNYVPRADVANKIEHDPADFFVRYRIWKAQDPLPTAPEEMITYFGGWEDSEDALNAGDSAAGKSAGDVLSGDCPHFNDFVKWGHDNMPNYTQSQFDEYKIPIRLAYGGRNASLLAFEMALRRYFKGEALSVLELSVLNGTIIAEAEFSGSILGYGQKENRLFVIPGYDVILGDRDLNDPLWRGVKDIVRDAFQKDGSRLINLSGAVQLRLGAKDSTTFNPIVVAPGFTIKGGM